MACGEPYFWSFGVYILALKAQYCSITSIFSFYDLFIWLKEPKCIITIDHDDFPDEFVKKKFFSILSLNWIFFSVGPMRK